MIEKGHFLPGATRLTGDTGINETYRGTIEVGEDRIVAYVKLMTERQVANELAASALAQLAGLKVPRAFLVLARFKDYPDSPFLTKVNGDAIGFATEAAANGAARRMTLVSPQAITDVLKKWKEWPDAAAFDEWIANIDRNVFNFLIAGNGEVWLIDHSHAFTGPAWTVTSLDPSAFLANKLCEMACLPGGLSLTEKMNAYASTLSACAVFAKVLVDDALKKAHLEHRLSLAELTALGVFLTARRGDVGERISKRLGLPGLALGAPA